LTTGAAEIRFGYRGGVTRLDHLYHRDPLRVLFPAPAVGDPLLAVLLTTSGGLVAGDRTRSP
jgi:urease accessory protein